MELACCLWALTVTESDALRSMADLGFGWIDIQPGQLRSQETRRLAQELGLSVSCLGASFGTPAGAELDDENSRDAAIAHAAAAIDQAASLDARTVYVIPGLDSSRPALSRYGDAACELADLAQGRDITFAIEHFPGTALPSAADTLAFIHDLRHPNVKLLYDSGHIQMTGEDPARVIAAAGDKLAYVHFDDNDGAADLHWALLEGVMTPESLRSTIDALRDIGYGGKVSLELNPSLADPIGALARSRDILAPLLA